MRTTQATALTIFLLLIPHQEPVAQETPTVEPERAPAAASGVATRDGFVWSRSTSPAGPESSRSVASDHLVIDGYTWSARSERSALDSTR